MDKCFHIMQGDSYPIEFAFYDEETGKKITNSEVSKIEFILGNTRKVYPDVGKWDEENGVFLIPFSQEDTFKLREGGTIIQDSNVYMDMAEAAEKRWRRATHARTL